jgi:hypothetical protein
VLTLFPENCGFRFTKEEKWYDWEEKPDYDTAKNETL